MIRFGIRLLPGLVWLAACTSGDGTGQLPPPGITCPEGFADCTGAKVCDTDLRTSSDHCGMCNHACGGAECGEGWCDLVGITTAPERSPSGLAAIRDTGAVWAINGGAALRTWSALEDTVTTLVSVSPAPTVAGKLVRTLVDETHAYWLNPEEGVLRRTSLATPAVEVVVPTGVRLFALRGADVVWIDGDGRLSARAKAGGDTRVLATGLVAPSELAASHVTVGFIDGTTLVRFRGDDFAAAVRWSPPGDPTPTPYALKLAEGQGPDDTWYDKTGWIAWDLPDGRVHLGQCAILGSCGTVNEGWTWTLGRPSSLLLSGDGGNSTPHEERPTYAATYTLVRSTASDTLGQLVRWTAEAELVSGVVASDLALDATHVYLLNGVTGQVSRIVR